MVTVPDIFKFEMQRHEIYYFNVLNMFTLQSCHTIMLPYIYERIFLLIMDSGTKHEYYVARNFCGSGYTSVKLRGPPLVVWATAPHPRAVCQCSWRRRTYRITTAVRYLTVGGAHFTWGDHTVSVCLMVHLRKVGWWGILFFNNIFIFYLHVYIYKWVFSPTDEEDDYDDDFNR